MYEFFKARIISYHVFKQYRVTQKKSRVGKADIINVCDILRHFSNTSPLAGEICTFFKASTNFLLRCFCASLGNFRAPSGLGEAQSDSPSAVHASVR